jgi:TRAP-type mannitol/chloroaromatic compound transport system permease small subunit
MQKLLLGVDRISTAVGKAFAWLILALTLLITWEVLSRKLFSSAHPWTFDAQIMVYGVLFMMAGAYTLSKNGHVRGDVLYGFFPPRLQASIDLVLYVFFFVPGAVAMVYAGYTFAMDSWAIREHSTISVDGPPLYPFKAFIPIAGSLMLLQGVVEIIRCVICLRDGQWPSRQQDVQEVDVEELKEMVKVTDADIAALAQLEPGKPASDKPADNAPADDLPADKPPADNAPADNAPADSQTDASKENAP